MIKSLRIIGAGGHAKVVADAAVAAGFTLRGFYDDDPHKRGTKVGGAAFLGVVSMIPVTSHDFFIMALGTNSVRQKLAAKFPNLRWASVVHPRACVCDSVRIGLGTVVLAGAVVQTDAVIDDHCIINTGASVDHDCLVASFCHLAPGVRLAGEVTLEQGVFMGIGSVVIPQRTVGAWTTVGAGGVVIENLPSWTTAVGVPARPIGRKSGIPEQPDVRVKVED